MVATTEVLWGAFHQRLRAYVARRIESPADVDDIVQDIFVRIHARIDSIEDTDRIHAWIYQIARNTIIDYYRVPRRRRERLGSDAELDLVHAPDIDADDTSAAEELAPCLTPLLEQLAPNYRAALELTEFQGLTQREAALVQEISVSGLKSRVQRGRRQLHDLLRACCEIELDRRGGVINYSSRESTCACCTTCDGDTRR
ncbi:MAG TPA: RNA polymerase sigma factor SigZ [Thermomicrobiales bacterium]|nr:RNA polymerase sigma factor SigZ [Thermomicrobiales bacterium]